MNVYDSARMADALAESDYVTVDDPSAADLVILNTCHIREKATEKVFSELGRLRVRREEAGNGGQLIAVAGCVAQAEGEEIVARAPWVDMVFGPQTYHRLPEMVRAAEQAAQTGDRRAQIDTEFPVESKFDFLPEESRSQGPSAFLTIQEGCDKFCTFCVVPYTRGAEASRPAADVLREARRLVANGSSEITLLGQNVNAYHGLGPEGQEWGLGRLAYALAEIDGLERIRYTTSHPRDMDEMLIRAHGEVPQLMPYLHLPVQSGSDRILAAMNRKHTADDYRRLVDRLRSARPDLALSSDFIVGYPGETDRDFGDTLRLVRETGFAQAYSFKYSVRPGTPASEQSVQVDEKTKADRLEGLQQLLGAQTLAFNKASIGSIQPVLVERFGNRDGQVAGRGPWMQSIHFDGPDSLVGRIVPVEIFDGHPNSLSGRLPASGGPLEKERMSA